MIQEELYQQYLDEVGSLDRYGSKNVITFDEWKWLKSTIENTRPVCESELNSYKELLGHSTQDIDTLENGIKNKMDITNIKQKKTEWGIVYRYRGDNYRFVLYVYDDDVKTMYLSNVRVNPTARKKGIGNYILVTAEDEAKKYGADTIFLVVSKSSWVHDWYKRHGFVDFMIDKYKDYVWMQKQIN